MVKRIDADDLRQMEDKEGLILQGCGGSLREWVDGINEILAEGGILLNDTRFRNVSVFEHGGIRNLLFAFDDVELDIGKLALWRIQTLGTYSGVWLSDYEENRLGGFQPSPRKEKPNCELIGQDGNIFNLIGIASRTLCRCGMEGQALEMQERITGGSCNNYYEALGIIGEYVNITGPSDDEKMRMEGM